MDKLTIITPCTRLENLPAMAESIKPGRLLFDVCWLIIFDAGEYPESHYGNEQRNSGLEAVKGGWVYFLDDDNIIHPRFYKGLARAIQQYPEVGGFLFKQELDNGVVREVNPTVNNIDIAQIVVKRKLVGKKYFDADPYNADGIFIEQLFERIWTQFIILDEVMAYYNRLKIRSTGRPDQENTGCA